MKLLVGSICVIFVSITISESWRLNVDKNTLTDDDDDVVYRLPETLVPTFYDLSLTIDPLGVIFSGNVKITFDVAENITTDEIYIHLDISCIIVLSAKLNDNISCIVGRPNEVNISKVKCSKAVTGSDNILYIEYNAKFSTGGYGVVKKSYMDQGASQLFVESVFEPTYARRAFPCFDEPDLRARFSVEINHPPEYNAISNSPITTKSDSSTDSVTTKFEVTPRISTYLVSFIISKLHSTDIKSDDGIEFKILTRTDAANLTSKVVEKYYGKILDKLGDYTGIPYQNIKDTGCYQAALPEYFDTPGGFGFFRYRETDLLDDGEQTTPRITQDIVTKIAYNLVHEWYGGDVAVSWWSDIWTNEAIATYLAYIIADEVNNEFDIKNQFIMEVVRKSLQTDAYSFVQPLSSNESIIEDVSDITNKLDQLSYQKGASLLRMINYFIGGEDQMKSSLSLHLMQRNETDSDGSDLIKDLTENHNTEDDLYSYLLPWISAPGYPIVTAKVVNVTGTGVEVIQLTQKRFLYPTKDVEQNDNTKWVIPVNGATSNSDQFYVTIEVYYPPDIEFFYFYGKDTYLIFNVQTGFFYRVNYDEVMWRRIIAALKDKNQKNIIDPITRAQLIDDIFNIARTGEVSYSVTFQLADFLAIETEYYPWYTAFEAFSYLLGKTGDDKAEDNLKVYILDLMTNVLAESKFKASIGDETHIDVLKRVMVLKWACDLNHTESVNDAIVQFKKYKNKLSLDDYNLRSVIYCNGIRYSEKVEDDWEFLWGIYTTTSSVHEQTDILTALGCTENEELLNTYLHKITTHDSGLKKQDFVTVFKSIVSSSAGLMAAMSFLDQKTVEIVSQGDYIWKEILYTVAEELLTDGHLKWLNSFLENKLFDGYEDVKTKTKTLASVNNYWQNNFQVYVKEVLINSDTTTTTTTTTTVTTNTEETTHTSSPGDLTSTPDIPTTPDSGSCLEVFSIITATALVLTISMLN